MKPVNFREFLQQFEFTFPVGLDRPSQIHHHRHLDDLEDVNLESAYLQDTARAVDGSGLDRTDVEFEIQDQQHDQREQEAPLGQPLEYLDVVDLVETEDHGQAAQDREELGADDVDAGGGLRRELGSGREDGDHRDQAEGEHDDPDHLVSGKAVHEVDTLFYFLPVHLTGSSRPP